jgi:flagellar biosynthesis protein FlhA
MDGASKFVRGDAIAGLLITAINIIAGVAIGVLQQGISLGEAGASYTQLTIGDGLVTQIPALVISIAAGLLVSKAGVDGAADKALSDQFLRQPQGLALAGMTAAITGMLPGMPIIPFALIAGACGFGAWQLSKRDVQKAAAEVQAAQAAPLEPAEEPIQTALALDELKIELGFGLLPLLNDVDGRKLTDQIKALRRQLAGDLGVVIPSVRILDNLQLVSEEYCIRVKEMEAGRGRLKLHHLLVMDPSGQVSLPGEQVKEPVFGLPALWIDQGLREEATFRNCTVVDPATVLTTHLTEILKEHVPDLLNFAAVQKLLKDLPKEHQKLVEDIVPGQISHSGIQRVLQTLLREQVSIRDLPKASPRRSAPRRTSCRSPNMFARVWRARSAMRIVRRTVRCPSSRYPQFGRRRSPRRWSVIGRRFWRSRLLNCMNSSGASVRPTIMPRRRAKRRPFSPAAESAHMCAL